MDSREFLAGTRRVRRFVPRGSVRELRVRGGRITGCLRARVGASTSGLRTFRRGVGQRAVRRLRLAADLTGPARSSAIGAAWRPCTAQTGKRRAFSGERSVRRRLHNAERFEESVLPAAGSAASRPGFRGRRRAGARSIVQRSERSRERAAPRGALSEGGFRRALRPLFADGRRCKIFRQACLVFAGRRFCRIFGRFFVRSSAPRFRRRLPSLRAAAGSAAFQTVT